MSHDAAPVAEKGILREARGEIIGGLVVALADHLVLKYLDRLSPKLGVSAVIATALVCTTIFVWRAKEPSRLVNGQPTLRYRRRTQETLTAVTLVVLSFAVWLHWRDIQGPRLPRPVALEDTLSVSIPFTDGEGRPVPPKKADRMAVERSTMICVSIENLAEAETKASAKPRSTDEVFTFLQELMQYLLLECMDSIQNDKQRMQWDFRQGQRTTVVPGNVPPDAVFYPESRLQAVLARNRFSQHRLELWRRRQFKVPEGTEVQFSKESVPKTSHQAFRFQLRNSAVYTLSFTIFRRLFVDNYGFVPPDYDMSPEVAARTKTYPLIVKSQFEFTEPGDSEGLKLYQKWVEGLFDGFRKGFGFSEADPSSR